MGTLRSPDRWRPQEAKAWPYRVAVAVSGTCLKGDFSEGPEVLCPAKRGMSVLLSQEAGGEGGGV